jgi:hypothetical protein
MGGIDVTETEKVVMLRVLLSFVQEIHQGHSAPGPNAILNRLRRFTETADRDLRDSPV